MSLPDKKPLFFSIGGRTRLAVPRNPRNARESGMRLYIPHNLAARFSWDVIGWLARAGIYLLQSKADEDPFVQKIMHNWEFYKNEICKIGGIEWIGDKNIISAFYFPPQRQKLKVGILLMRNSGTPIGYAALGFDEASRQGMLRESKALDWLQRLHWNSFSYPKMLDYGNTEEYSYLIKSVKPDNAFRCKKSSPAVLQCLKEIREKSLCNIRFEDIEWLSAFQDKNISYRRIYKMLEMSSKQQTFSMCAVHGDYSPWNMLMTENGQLWIFDWEEYSSSGPYLADYLFYFIAIELLLKNSPPLKAAQYIARIISNNNDGSDCRLEDSLLALAYMCSKTKIVSESLWEKFISALLDRIESR
jgi:hypothetical protein